MTKFRSAIIVVTAFVLGWGMSWYAQDALYRPTLPSPERPVNVPTSASWSGGADGGAWFDCKELEFPRFQCAVYAETTGVVITEGIFQLILEYPDGTKRLRYAYYSGSEIYLSHARLVKVSD